VATVQVYVVYSDYSLGIKYRMTAI